MFVSHDQKSAKHSPQISPSLPMDYDIVNFPIMKSEGALPARSDTSRKYTSNADGLELDLEGGKQVVMGSGSHVRVLSIP